MEEERRNEEPKKEKKKHKGLKRSAIAIALAAIIAVCGSIVKSLPNKVEGTVSDVISKNEDTSLFDEILDLDETIGVTNPETEEIEKIQVEDAIRLLEDKIDISKKIKNLKIKNDNLKELSNHEKNVTLKFLEENGIDALIELYNTDSNNKIEKARFAQQLLYINEVNNKWLELNGIPVSKSILTRIISSGAIQAYGTFDPKDYEEVIELDLESNSLFKKIVFNDPISGEKDKISLMPILADEYYDAYNELEDLSTAKNENIDDIYDHANKSLNIAKRCINKELKKDKIFVYTHKNNNKKGEK